MLGGGCASFNPRRTASFQVRPRLGSSLRSYLRPRGPHPGSFSAADMGRPTRKPRARWVSGYGLQTSGLILSMVRTTRCLYTKPSSLCLCVTWCVRRNQSCHLLALEVKHLQHSAYGFIHWYENVKQKNVFLLKISAWKWLMFSCLIETNRKRVSTSRASRHFYSAQ